LISRLNREKYNITVVSVGLGGPLEERFRALGFPTFIIPKKSRFDFRLPFKLAKLMRQTQADLVMSTLFYADIMAALASYMYKPKALVSWEVITGRLKWHQIAMYKLLSGRFDMVAAVSNSIHPFIINQRGQGQEKIRTIYYGVDLSKYAATVTISPNCKIVFGTVARLVYQKGHTHLLDAIPMVVQRCPQAVWQFVGYGEKEAELKEKAKRLGIEQYVEFLGKRDDVPELLRQFDIFVLPSLWEGFPNVVLEAMACIKPVIATAVEGTVELVMDGVTGLLVPKEDPVALAAAMIKIIENPHLIAEFGSGGRRRVEEHFSLEKQIREFEELYDELIGY